MRRLTWKRNTGRGELKRVKEKWGRGGEDKENRCFRFLRPVWLASLKMRQTQALKTSEHRKNFVINSHSTR